MRLIRAFSRDERGATSIEYAVIAGLISIVIVTAARSIGVKLAANYYTPVANNLT